MPGRQPIQRCTGEIERDRREIASQDRMKEIPAMNRPAEARPAVARVASALAGRLEAVEVWGTSVGNDSLFQ